MCSPGCLAPPCLNSALRPAHHCWCASADREDLRLTQKEFVGLPFPLLLQLLAAAALCLGGGLQVSGEFKPIALANNKRCVASARWLCN